MILMKGRETILMIFIKCVLFRCKEYKSLGCMFAKWRMVVSIGEDIPSIEAIEEGARGLAMYAGICQRNG